MANNANGSLGTHDRGGKDAFVLELSKSVSANTQTTSPESKETDVPWDGRVTGLTIGWQSGTNNQVGVRFRDETGFTYIPYNTYDEEDYVAANDFTRTFPVRFDVAEDETLIAEFVNLDANNAHFVNVMVDVVRDEG